MTEQEIEFIIEKKENCQKKALTFPIDLDVIIIFAAAYGVLQIEKLGFPSYRDIPFNELLSYGMQALGLFSIGRNRGWNKRGRKEGRQQMEDYDKLLHVEKNDELVERMMLKKRVEEDIRSMEYGKHRR